MSAIGDDPKDLRIGGVSKTGSTEAPQAADGVSEAGAVASVEGVDAAQGGEGLDEIARAIGAGSLDPAAAKAQLIDQAVAAQLPEGASPQLVAEVRAEVAALLEADPLLEDLLRR